MSHPEACRLCETFPAAADDFRRRSRDHSDVERMAVIDMGSNSFRLVVFDYEPGSWWRLADEIREATRVSAGMGEDGVLQPEAIAPCAPPPCSRRSCAPRAWSTSTPWRPARSATPPTAPAAGSDPRPYGTKGARDQRRAGGPAVDPAPPKRPAGAGPGNRPNRRTKRGSRALRAAPASDRPGEPLHPETTPWGRCSVKMILALWMAHGDREPEQRGSSELLRCR